MLQDLRFALRLMARARWFTAMAVIALALGIGANATIYSIFHAALVRGLPFRDSGRLALVSLEARQGYRVSLSVPELADFRPQTRTFDGLAAFRAGQHQRRPRDARAGRCRGSPRTPSRARQPPLIGRDFSGRRPEGRRAGRHSRL